MKFIFYAFNYLTLFKALKYKTYLENDKSVIVYCDLITPLPPGLRSSSDIVSVSAEKYRRKTSGLTGVVFGAIASLNSANTIERLILDIDDQVTIVLFRDNEPQEATIIDRIHKRFKSRIRIWLIEEGSGIYSDHRLPIRKRWIKKILYYCLGVSQYALAPYPQGMNPCVDKIICAKPHVLPHCKAEGKTIEKQIDIFSQDYSRECLGLILRRDIACFSNDYRFVFLSEPIDDHGLNNPLYFEYDAFLNKLISVVTKYGKILIKPHPRDKFDYRPYLSEKVEICDFEISSIPFECLYAFLNYPTILSLYSSVNANNNLEKHSFYLYKLMGSSLKNIFFSDEYLLSNHIIVCKDFEDFSIQLKRQYG